MQDIKRELIAFMERWIGKTINVQTKTKKASGKVLNASITPTKMILRTDEPLIAEISFDYPENYGNIRQHPRDKKVEYLISWEGKDRKRAFTASEGEVFFV